MTTEQGTSWHLKGSIIGACSLDCNQAEEWESLRKFMAESWLSEEVTFDEANKM